MLLNGPESFTPDGNFILGEAPELRNYFVCAGFNSAGIANSRRRRPADRRVDRRRRAQQRPVGRRHPPLRRRSPATAGAGRAHRRDAGPALRDALAAPGAGDGAAAAHLAAVRPARGEGRRVRRQERLGARELLPRRPGRDTRPYPHTLGTPGWLPDVVAEQQATREAVALYDQTSFGKLLLQGRDALALLQRLCANEMDVRGRPHGLHADAQRARRHRERPHRDAAGAPTASSSSPARRRRTRDLDWIARHIARERARGRSPTSSAMTAVLSLMGPNARELLAASVSPTTCSPRGAEVFADDARDRPRLRARPRRAHELRRRAGLRALRAGRDGAPRLPGAARRKARPATWGCATPATTRSTRCASRPAAAPGAPSSAPTRRRCEAGLALQRQAATSRRLHRPRRARSRRRASRRARSW